MAARFDEPEPTPEFDVGLSHAAESTSTHDDPDRTHLPSDDEAYAAMAAENPPEDMVITRMVGPSPADLQKSRPERDGSATQPKQANRAPYAGFEEGDDEETTTGTGRRR
jgi:hypothetical protein